MDDDDYFEAYESFQIPRKHQEQMKFTDVFRDSATGDIIWLRIIMPFIIAFILIFMADRCSGDQVGNDFAFALRQYGMTAHACSMDDCKCLLDKMPLIQRVAGTAQHYLLTHDIRNDTIARIAQSWIDMSEAYTHYYETWHCDDNDGLDILQLSAKADDAKRMLITLQQLSYELEQGHAALVSF
jgi:hypothetical protein